MTVLLILLALALADSTSIGTLVIPIWFLLGAKLHAGKYLLYTGTVALFYFCVGLVGLAGAVPALQALGNLPTTLPFLWTELFAGIALIVLAFRLDPKRRAHPAKESRIQRWHRLILTGKLSNKSIMRMGLAAE